MKASRVFVPALVLALGACEGGTPPPSSNAVAQAAGVELTVDAAAEILAPHSDLPNQPEVVEALANLWVDYFLLARASATDTTFSNLDVSSLVEQNVTQEMVFRLREEVIQVDTAISDAELTELYQQDLPGARVRARHILFQVPENALPAQTDSVRALAQSVRSRILAGESFPILAGEFSQDPGSAPNGGDLGSFQRGEMVPPFEEAAFALEVGEVSEIVETMFGLHLIQVDERTIPEMEGNLEQFRAQIQNRRVMVAESTYVAGVIETGDIQVEGDIYETARQLSATPDMELTSRALRRTLVTFRGGNLTVDDFQNWLLLRAGEIRGQIEGATDEQLEALLRNIAREQLLVSEARDMGVEVSQERQDSLATGIRSGIQTVSRQLGLLPLTVEAGQSVDEVAEIAAMEILARIVQQELDVIPLGGVSIVLRDQFDAEINGQAIERTVARITALRAEVPPVPQPLVTPDTVSAQAGDTTGAQG